MRTPLLQLGTQCPVMSHLFHYSVIENTFIHATGTNNLLLLCNMEISRVHGTVMYVPTHQFLNHSKTKTLDLHQFCGIQLLYSAVWLVITIQQVHSIFFLSARQTLSCIFWVDLHSNMPAVCFNSRNALHVAASDFLWGFKVERIFGFLQFLFP